MKIAITGSIAFDYIMRYPRTFREMLLDSDLDNISVSFLVDEMSKQRGGVAPNIAYTLALLGEHPTVVGTAGKDFYEYKDALDNVGVDTGGVRIYDDVFTASFFVSTDENLNQIAMFYTGAMAYSKDLTIMEVVSPSPDLVVISPNDPVAMRNAVKECKTNDISYMYDPSQQVARIDAEDLAEGVNGAKILVVNEYEYSALKSKTGLSHEILLSKADTIIVTRGKAGSDIYTNGELVQIPVATTDKVVDPTGVGDAFRAGLLKGLSAGWSWEMCGKIGAMAATYVLEQLGTQNHYFTPADFVTRFRTHFDDNGLLDILLTGG